NLALTICSAQKRFRRSRFSSMILPRCSNGTPIALNSRRYQPDAMPISSRPSDRRSMLASCLARMTGLRIGSTRMPVPSLSFLVRAAIEVRGVRDSVGGEKRQGLDDGKVGPTAEQNVSPPPDRAKPGLFHPHAVFDQCLGVRHLGIGGEILHRDAEGPMQASHVELLFCRTNPPRG